MVFERCSHNTLGSTVKELCIKAGIDGNRTNHFLTATTATRGIEQGIPDKLLMERTGHRSVSSLHVYQRPTEYQRKVVSLAPDDDVTVTDVPSSKRVCQSNQEEHVEEAWTASARRPKWCLKIVLGMLTGLANVVSDCLCKLCVCQV